jgi:phosphoglycolate phosphatase
MKLKDIKLIIFDWDGTLIESTGFACECIQRAAVELSLPVPTIKQIREVIGLSTIEQLKLLFPNTNVNVVFEAVRRHYLNNPCNECLLDGVVETLEYLRNKKLTLAIASNKNRIGLEASLARTKIIDFFAAIRCGDDGFPKPHAAMLLGILEELTLPPSAALMVGDTTYDMELARNAEVGAVAVCCGLHSKERLLEYSPIACIDEIKQLRDLLG